MGEREGGGEGGLRKRKGRFFFCLQRSRCLKMGGGRGEGE